MGKACKAAGLPAKAGLVVFILPVSVVEDLDGDRAPEGLVTAAIDLSHAAFTDSRFHLVGADCRSQSPGCTGILLIGVF
jgi:hypothetical protein